MVLSLDQITLDDRAWPRDVLDEERIELFAEMVRDACDAAGTGQGWSDPLPPLMVVADDRGGYVLADGRHRYEARCRLGAGFDLVPVQAFQPNDRAPLDFAYELALLCTQGAKPLTTAEKRAAIARLLAERRDLSDRAIARLVGVSHRTVGAHRAGVGNLPTGASDDSRRTGQDRAWLSTMQVAERLVCDFYELRQRTRKLLGFGEFDNASAGRKLAEAFTALYDGEAALDVIDDLGR
jgi:hypothetical protein